LAVCCGQRKERQGFVKATEFLEKIIVDKFLNHSIPCSYEEIRKTGLLFLHLLDEVT
jgi:hypothetical protein